MNYSLGKNNAAACDHSRHRRLASYRQSKCQLQTLSSLIKTAFSYKKWLFAIYANTLNRFPNFIKSFFLKINISPICYDVVSEVAISQEYNVWFQNILLQNQAEKTCFWAFDSTGPFWSLESHLSKNNPCYYVNPYSARTTSCIQVCKPTKTGCYIAKGKFWQQQVMKHDLRNKSTNRPHPSGAAPPWPHQPLLIWPHSLAPPGLNLASPCVFTGKSSIIQHNNKENVSPLSILCW